MVFGINGINTRMRCTKSSLQGRKTCKKNTKAKTILRWWSCVDRAP